MKKKKLLTWKTQEWCPTPPTLCTSSFLSKMHGTPSPWSPEHVAQWGKWGNSTTTLILINRDARMLMSTLLEADMEVQVFPSLTEQQWTCASIKARASLRLRVVDGLITTFEAINFMHLPINSKRYTLVSSLHYLMSMLQIYQSFMFYFLR